MYIFRAGPSHIHNKLAIPQFLKPKHKNVKCPLKLKEQLNFFEDKASYIVTEPIQLTIVL
jgi:hypothetical protein